MVKVDWGQTKQLYPVRLTVSAWDRVGLLRDITTQVSEEGVNIASVVTTENSDGIATISLTLYTMGIAQLSRLFSKLEGVRGVINAVRSSAETPAPNSR
jgi:GTP pyrophosphokinase